MNDWSSCTILVTAGPTHEPIDAVRFIGNRSSGRLGEAIANAAHEEGCNVILLLGPTTLEPAAHPEHWRVERFTTCADLERLLEEHWPKADKLIMAAAVADYRPVSPSSAGKISRTDARLTLKLEATPDLVAACCERKKPGQTVVGFALEPAAELLDQAKKKLKRKGLDAIVANPLETMDSREIEATLLWADGRILPAGRMNKEAFARWLVGQVMLK